MPCTTRADKTDQQTACMQTEYLVMAHGREESVQKARMPLVTNKRVSTDSNSRSNVPRGKKWRRSTPVASSHRVRTFSSARSGSAQRRRCETADLSPGFSIQIQAWPVLSSRQGPSRCPSSTGGSTVSSREVSKDRQTLRRLLSCLPASKPDSRFVLSVPLSVESPFLPFES